MKDTIREMDVELVDVLRIILLRQPERATMGYSGTDYWDKIMDTAFCAASCETLAEAMRKTGVNRRRIEKVLFLLRRHNGNGKVRIKQLLQQIPEAQNEVAYLLGETNWPLYLQDELIEAYQDAQGSSPEAMEHFLAQYGEHKLFPPLAAEWLLKARHTIIGLRQTNEAMKKQLRLTAAIAGDAEFCQRMDRLLQDDNERSRAARSAQEATGSQNDAPIEDLEFSVRTYNCLKKAKIDTLSSLSECTRERLAQIRNWGSRSQAEVDEVLERYNLP